MSDKKSTSYVVVFIFVFIKNQFFPYRIASNWSRSQISQVVIEYSKVLRKIMEHNLHTVDVVNDRTWLLFKKNHDSLHSTAGKIDIFNSLPTLS